MTSHLDDHDFVGLFREQDPISIRKLYDAFYRPLCYYTEKIVENQHEAEDIVVEAFIKLIRKRNDFSKLSEIKAFLYTATKNAAIDYLRKMKRHELAKSEILYINGMLLFDDAEVVNAEVLGILYQEIENLPPQCAAVFKLLFFQRLSTSEIALQLNITNKTVLNQKGKAIKQLRKVFLNRGMLAVVAILSLVK